MLSAEKMWPSHVISKCGTRSDVSSVLTAGARINKETASQAAVAAAAPVAVVRVATNGLGSLHRPNASRATQFPRRLMEPLPTRRHLSPTPHPLSVASIYILLRIFPSRPRTTRRFMWTPLQGRNHRPKIGGDRDAETRDTVFVNV